MLDARARAAATARSRTFFHAPDYGEALAAAGADILLLDGDDVGHALVMRQETRGFVTWVGLGEPVAAPGAADAFWRALVEAGREAGALSVAWRDAALARFLPDDVAAARRVAASLGAGFVAGELGSHLVEVARSPETLWAAFDRRHRNAARKAESSGVCASRAPQEGFAPHYARMSDQTFARSGRDGPAEPYFARLLGSAHAIPYVARDADGAPLAAAIVARWGAAATYLHGATSANAGGAGALLHWRIMQDLHTCGARTYDLGGAALPGSPSADEKLSRIRRFKERFGAPLVRWPRVQVVFDPEGYAAAKAALHGA